MKDDTNMPFTTGEDKLTKWSNEPTLQSLKGDLEASKPAHDTIVSRVKKWNDLLKVTGSAAPPKVKGHSSVQPKLVRRQAEWRYPALSEPFLSSSKLFKVTATTFEDEQAAEQNQLVLNWQFRTKLNNQVWHRGGPNTSDRTRYITQVTYARRIIGHKYYPFMNYQMPEHLYKDASPRLRRLLGFLDHGAYG